MRNMFNFLKKTPKKEEEVILPTPPSPPPKNIDIREAIKPFIHRVPENVDREMLLKVLKGHEENLLKANELLLNMSKVEKNGKTHLEKIIKKIKKQIVFTNAYINNPDSQFIDMDVLKIRSVETNCRERLTIYNLSSNVLITDSNEYQSEIDKNPDLKMLPVEFTYNYSYMSRGYLGGGYIRAYFIGSIPSKIRDTFPELLQTYQDLYFIQDYTGLWGNYSSPATAFTILIGVLDSNYFLLDMFETVDSSKEFSKFLDITEKLTVTDTMDDKNWLEKKDVSEPY